MSHEQTKSAQIIPKLIYSIEGLQKRLKHDRKLKDILQNYPPDSPNSEWQRAFEAPDEEFEVLIRILKERQQRDEKLKIMKKEVENEKYLHSQTFRHLQTYNPLFTPAMLAEKARIARASDDVRVKRLNQQIAKLSEKLKNTTATQQQVENRDKQLSQMESQIAMMAVHNDEMILKMTKDHDLNIKLLDAKVNEKEEIIASLKTNSKQMETKLRECEENLKVLEEGLEEKEYISMLKQKNLELEEKMEKIQTADPKALELELEELRARLSQLEMSQSQSPSSVYSHGSKRILDDEHPETPTNRRMRISENEDVGSSRSDDSDSWSRLSSDDIESIP